MQLDVDPSESEDNYSLALRNQIMIRKQEDV